MTAALLLPEAERSPWLDKAERELRAASLYLAANGGAKQRWPFFPLGLLYA